MIQCKFVLNFKRMINFFTGGCISAARKPQKYVIRENEIFSSWFGFLLFLSLNLIDFSCVLHYTNNNLIFSRILNLNAFKVAEIIIGGLNNHYQKLYKDIWYIGLICANILSLSIIDATHSFLNYNVVFF